VNTNRDSRDNDNNVDTDRQDNFNETIKHK